MSDVKLLSGDDLRRAADQAVRVVRAAPQLQGVIASAIDALNEVARHGEIMSAHIIIASCQETIDQQKERLKQLQGIGP